MSQTRQVVFGSLIETADMPTVVSNMMEPGRLQGLEFSVGAANILHVSPGSCLLPDGVVLTESKISELVVEASSFPTNYTIIYRLEDTSVIGGSPALLLVIPGIFKQTDYTDATVIGWIMYPGGSAPLNNSFFLQPRPVRVINPKASIYKEYLAPFNEALKISSTINVTGNLTSGSATVSAVSSMTGIAIGQVVTGAGIPANSLVTGVNTGSSQLTLSNNATSTATGVSLAIDNRWQETVVLINNEYTKKYLNLLGVPAIYSLDLPFIVDGSGQPNKLITRLNVDFSCIVTFYIKYKNNNIMLGTVANTGSLGTREFSIPKNPAITWTAGTTGQVNIKINAQGGASASLAHISLSHDNSPYLVFI